LQGIPGAHAHNDSGELRRFEGDARLRLPRHFFYVDPPYVSAEQGHYRGYTKENFDELLAVCQGLEGKFLLSSYPETALLEARERHGWASKDVEKALAVDGRRAVTKKKTECLTWNY
jgi:DNA adenine methylase